MYILTFQYCYLKSTAETLPKQQVVLFPFFEGVGEVFKQKGQKYFRAYFILFNFLLEAVSFTTNESENFVKGF